MLAVWENVLFFEPPTGVREYTHTHTETHERAHTQFIHKVEMGVHILQMQKTWIIHTGAEMHHHGHKHLQSPLLSRSLIRMHIYGMIIFFVFFSQLLGSSRVARPFIASPS